MEILTLRFQTPHDFHGFRRFIKEAMVSYNIANLEVVCKCEMKQIATAITQFGGLIIEQKAVK